MFQEIGLKVLFRTISNIMRLINYAIRKYNSLEYYFGAFKDNPGYIYRVLKNKFSNFLYNLSLIPFLPIIVPIVILIRALKYFYLIRIGNLESNGIGHFSLPVEIYLSELECGIHKNSKVIDLWYLHKIVSNKALRDKWREHLIILPRIILKPIHLVNRIIPGGLDNEIPYRRIENTIYASANNTRPWQQVDIHDVISRTKPRVILTNEEKLQCERILKNVGFDPNKKYVCVNIRDSAFHSDVGTQDHRNSSINEYIDAFSYLNELDYTVVRMGAKVTESLKRNNLIFFDYAMSGLRSELLDLYLISKCHFYIGTGAGLDMACSLFRKMTVFVNFSMIGTIPEIQYNSLVIFRKLMINDQVVSLPDIIKNKFERITLSQDYEFNNIKLKKNSNEEIRAVLWEAHSRVNNTWKLDLKDEDRQEIFRNYYCEKTKKNTIRARIGSEFLKSII
jgi:putative glycosyltransferase (TIGR04372 family)